MPDQVRDYLPLELLTKSHNVLKLLKRSLPCKQYGYRTVYSFCEQTALFGPINLPVSSASALVSIHQSQSGCTPEWSSHPCHTICSMNKKFRPLGQYGHRNSDRQSSPDWMSVPLTAALVKAMRNPALKPITAMLFSYALYILYRKYIKKDSSHVGILLFSINVQQ